jgi:hypothetical protein
MEPGNPNIESGQSRPLNCHEQACPAEGFIGAFLGNGGCIFCRAGQCLASPLTLSMFSIADAKPTRANPLPSTQNSPAAQAP